MECGLWDRVEDPWNASCHFEMTRMHNFVLL